VIAIAISQRDGSTTGATTSARSIITASEDVAYCPRIASTNETPAPPATIPTTTTDTIHGGRRRSRPPMAATAAVTPTASTGIDPYT
jgi:hypothetical protein